MEINGGLCNSGNKSQVEGEISFLSSNLFLVHVGEVTLTFDSDGLSWKSLDSLDNDGSTCLGIKFLPRMATKMATKLTFPDIYAVELMNGNVIQESDLTTATECFLGNDAHDSGMNNFIVHTFQKPVNFWVNKINGSLDKEVGRPKNLLVFVHPLSGKGNGRKTWETVAPIFSRAKINTKVIVTQRAGHAFDVMRSTTNEELNSYDGVLAVGGDGFFNEILNGYLSSRHKAPFPPVPSDFLDTLGNDNNPLVNNPTEADSESRNTEESDPFLSGSAHNESGFSHLRTNDGSLSVDQQTEYPLPNQKLRFGIIPAGSTDAIVICTTGARDPITSALHIILGKRLCLDVAQVVRWKTNLPQRLSLVYGFYGDVITESEKYRWMGPKRYDYNGTKVFLKHRSYEVEVGYLEVECEKDSSISDGSRMFSKARSLKRKKSERIICRANCNVCNTKPVYSSAKSTAATPYISAQETKWLKSKGRFLSVGAAIMSNRNERAPDGLVADAHLSDVGGEGREIEEELGERERQGLGIENELGITYLANGYVRGMGGVKPAVQQIQEGSPTDLSGRAASPKGSPIPVKDN
ncbi:Ceramide kinase [Hibiscus syriacus]|uniref:Ceramide kinase n=1 Tax=Hibiscus syriacus TaxID=106335 RepID=A0A6A2X575_HIBSY|nr:Ceramide kinase [Hibiscus syriacus]